MAEISLITSNSRRERFISFCWQHLLLIISLFIMTFGVALCIRSALGSSVISSIPLVMTLAGENLQAPALSIGDYTNIMNCILVGVQILILRRRFEKIQLLQLVIGFLFGWLLDLNMWLTSSVVGETLAMQTLLQIGGCIVLGLGIAFEVRCGSVTMPGEGVPAAMCKAYGFQFPKAKIIVDITLVVIAVVLGFYYFGTWMWNVIGPGTLFAMVFVGLVVKFVGRYLSWFNRLLAYRPGFRRYIYGLARFIAG